jgi:hypothetical protein
MIKYSVPVVLLLLVLMTSQEQSNDECTLKIEKDKNE